MVTCGLKMKDIRQCWELVRPGLEEVREESKAEWRPEDVYAFCATGRAGLYMSDDDDGFLILKKTTCPFTGVVKLLIWAAWGPGMLHDKYLPEIERIAREEGAMLIEFKTKRRGFERRHEWEPTYTTYQRRVS